MSEAAKKKRPITFVVAAVLAIPTFAAGLWVGKSSVKAAPTHAPSTSEEVEQPGVDNPVRDKLAACQRKLARRMKGQPAMAEEVDDERKEPKQPTSEQLSQMEWLEDGIKTCRRSEILYKAKVCKTVREHFDLMMGLPDDGRACKWKFFVGEHILENFEKCSEFKDVPHDLDTSELTEDEMNSVLDAIDVTTSIKKEELAEKLGHISPECLKTSRKR